MGLGRFIYNVKGVSYQYLPRTSAKKAIKSYLSDKKSKLGRKGFDYALEELKNRVDFYCKINKNFICNKNTLQENIPIRRFKILDPNYSRFKDIIAIKAPSSYRYDMSSYARYFDKNLGFNFAFGDVDFFINSPSITKTRPILENLGSNDLEVDSIESARSAVFNSCILKLDSFRHFCFVKDKRDFNEKDNLLFWRGGAYQEHRIRFLRMHFGAKYCDIGHVGSKAMREFLVSHANTQEHLKHKFLLSLEGNDVASNLKWILGSNSLVFMPRPKFEGWFMESKLRGGSILWS